MKPIGAAAFLCLLTAATARAAGDAEAGKELALRWCNSCHIVDQSGRGPDTAPPFPILARRSPNDRTWLRAWLTDPHPPMPNFNLSREQIDDVVAYLDSMAPR
jgi:cytochrome c